MDGSERFASTELVVKRAIGIEYVRWVSNDTDFGYPRELR
jgi:hypothetical protein